LIVLARKTPQLRSWDVIDAKKLVAKVSSVAAARLPLLARKSGSLFLLV
jgi:hypothetical protein